MPDPENETAVPVHEGNEPELPVLANPSLCGPERKLDISGHQVERATLFQMGPNEAEARHREFTHRLGHAAQFLHARNNTPNIAEILRQIILKVTLHTSSKLKQRVHRLQSIFDDRSQLFPASLPCIHDLAQWHRLTGQIGRYRPAEEPFSVEDLDLTNVSRVESNRDLLTDIGRKGERQVTEGVKVNAVWPHSSCPDAVNQQQIQTLQTVGHAWQ